MNRRQLNGVAGMRHRNQCDQIWQFFGLWATFQSLLQQLICPNLLHSQEIFVKVSKSIIFQVKSFFGQLLQTFGDFLLVTLPTIIIVQDHKMLTSPFLCHSAQISLTKWDWVFISSPTQTGIKLKLSFFDKEIVIFGFRKPHLLNLNWVFGIQHLGYILIRYPKSGRNISIILTRKELANLLTPSRVTRCWINKQPNFSKICPKSNHCTFQLNTTDVSKITQPIAKYLWFFL